MLLEELPGLGLEEGEEVTDLDVIHQLLLLLRREGPVLVPRGQFIDSCVVFLAETEIEKGTGGLRGEVRQRTVDDPRKDRGLAFPVDDNACFHLRVPLLA